MHVDMYPVLDGSEPMQSRSTGPRNTVVEISSPSCEPMSSLGSDPDTNLRRVWANDENHANNV